MILMNLDANNSLHDTYFLREMYFKTRQKMVEIAQTPHRRDDNTYLMMRQRGQITGAAEHAEGRRQETINLLAKSFGYSPIERKASGYNISSLVGYSSFNAPVSYGVPSGIPPSTSNQPYSKKGNPYNPLNSLDDVQYLW